VGSVPALNLPVTGDRPRQVERFKYALVYASDMQFQGRSTRKRTGGRRRHSRNKRKYELGDETTETELDRPTLKTIDARGTTEKVRAISTNVASVADGDEVVEADIENVVENPANPNYIRRNIITKGAVIETSEGQARVTSRPGQDGQVNAVLIE
jgi:small subunit ribosomal protein S8e